VDWSLSLSYIASSLIVVGVFIVTNGLWEGALSPILTIGLQLQDTLDVPASDPGCRGEACRHLDLDTR
jgi:hypothetical protein